MKVNSSYSKLSESELDEKVSQILGKRVNYSTKIEDSYVLLNILRNSGKWCCIKLDSDYNYCWYVLLTHTNTKDHKETIKTQAISLERAITEAFILANERY